MNGQQLTNSSNSANDTPTSPSSSYPASLSSQSSRDPSPATRTNSVLSGHGGNSNLSQKSYQESHIRSTNVYSPSHNHLSSSNQSDQLKSNTGNIVNHVIQPVLMNTTKGTIIEQQKQHNFGLSSQHLQKQSMSTVSPLSVSNHITKGGNIISSHTERSQANTSVTNSLINQPQNKLTNQFSVPQTSQKYGSESYIGTPNTRSIPNTGLKPEVSSDVSRQIPQSQSLHSQPLRAGGEGPFTSNQPLQHPPSVQTSPIQQKPVQSGQKPELPSVSYTTQSGITNLNDHNVSHSSHLSLPSPNQFQSLSSLPIQSKSISSQQQQFHHSSNPLSQFSRPSSQTQNPITFSQPLQHSPVQSSLPTQPQQNQLQQSSPHRFPQTQSGLHYQQQVQNHANQIQQNYNTTGQFVPPPHNNQFQKPTQPSLSQQSHQLQYQQHSSASHLGKRYPQMPSYTQQQPLYSQQQTVYSQQPGYLQQPNIMGMDGLSQQMSNLNVTQAGFNKLWGMDTVDLLKTRDILPREKLEPPPIRLHHELYEASNCSPDIFRCTLTKIPETKSLLDKSRLPLGVLIHPFKDLDHLSVIQCTVIVRCRLCRTYINPFVYFVDNKRWKCNLCFRVNELPDEFQFDPMTKTYGDPSRRPEIKSATIEFIAPSEYMVRPPQPAVYVFLFDVSRLAADCGYLEVACRVLLENLDKLPGDARTSVAFITFDSAVHFYSLTEGQAQPHQMVVVDIEDMFLPCPENLLVNLSECHELIRDLLVELPNKFKESYDTGCALGAALQAAYKLLAPTGGRITVFQSCLPNMGPGALTPREDPAQRASENVTHLNPVTDFYKKLALDCSGQQIAVDLFLVNSQYVDLATLSGVSRFSGGCMHHFPLFRADKPFLVQSLEKVLHRYLTRKIGFESVMRLRCTRGLSIHTFHGNFFVRSTDLLSLPNANPDAGFGMQVSIDENLSDIQTVCFQAALLYTSSKGERRIRVHTLCLPITSNLSEVMHGADQQCIVGLLAKMAVDRSVQSSLSDAREAFVNVVADVLSAFRVVQSSNAVGCVLAPSSLRLLPLYILSLLKYVAFRTGQSTRLDDRVFAMCQMKTLPLCYLVQAVYPDLYPLNDLDQLSELDLGDHTVVQPPRLHLSAERLDSQTVFLLDDGASLIIYVGHNVDPTICQAMFDVPHFAAIPQEMFSLPELANPLSERLRHFVTYLQDLKPFSAPLQIIRDDSHYRMRFLERLVEDKNEAGTSYYEFLQRIKLLIK